MRPAPLARLLLLSAFTLFACADDEAGVEGTGASQGPSEPVDTNDLLAAADEAGLTTFTALADTIGLAETLRGEGPYTVFVPTNEAFEALPQATLDSLLVRRNRPRLEGLLKYHVVPGRIETNMLPITVRTLEGEELSLESGADGTVVRDAQGNTAQVVRPDVNVTNGVVHVVSGVLSPADEAEGDE